MRSTGWEGAITRQINLPARNTYGDIYKHDKHRRMQNMCECVERQQHSSRALMCLSACVSVNVCERCLAALVRDSSFECIPCVQRRVCLFANSEEEKGKGKKGAKRSAAVFDEGRGRKGVKGKIPSPFLPPCVSLRPKISSACPY